MQLASTYAKEMHAIVQAVGKWRYYLLGNHFVINTDHHSIKNILTQVIQTPDQQIFFWKLLDYDYSICYKPDKENRAADALSRELTQTFYRRS